MIHRRISTTNKARYRHAKQRQTFYQEFAQHEVEILDMAKQSSQHSNQPTQQQQGNQSSSATFACPPNVEQQLVGIDWKNLDLTKMILIVRTLLELFKGPVTPDVFKAAMPNCPDECCRHCCEAMRLSLESAEHSYLCCESMSNTSSGSGQQQKQTP